MSGTRLPKEWADLTADEQDMLRRINTGATSLMTVVQVDHMIARGLAEKRIGGTGLSPAGKGISERMAAVARAAAAKRKQEM